MIGRLYERRAFSRDSSLSAARWQCFLAAMTTWMRLAVPAFFAKSALQRINLEADRTYPELRRLPTRS